MKATILMICNVSLIFLTRDVFLRFVYQLNMCIFFLHFFLVYYTMLFVCFLCRKWKGSSKMNHCFLFFCLNVSFCQGVRLFFFIFHSNTTIIINNNSRLYSYYVAVLSIFFMLIMFIFHYIFFYFQSFFFNICETFSYDLFPNTQLC